MKVCPQWETWGSWTLCDKTCDGGIKLRERACNVEVERCLGQAIEKYPCNIKVQL